jgi:hypothetical protein
MKGLVSIYDSYGNLIFQDFNLIVTEGRFIQADLLVPLTAQNTIWIISIGSDDGTLLPLHPSNTSLGNETASKIANVVQVTHTRIQYEASFTNGDTTQPVKECGLFIQFGSNPKRLYARRLLATPIILDAGGKTFRWELFT